MSGRSHRVLFMAEAVTLSHVARPAALASALDPDRHEVTVACDPRYDSLVAGRPFRVLPLQSSVPRDGLADVLTANRPLFDAPTLDRYVAEDLAIFAVVRPDLVVGDMRQSLAVSAPLAGVPFMNVINAQWSPYARIEFELPENPYAPFVGETVGGLLWRVTAPVGFAQHTLPINAVRLKHGLPPIGLDIKAAYSFGDFVAYPDLPELVPTPGAPATHRHIGPIMWAPEVERPAWWDALPGDRPLVYVSLGSSGRHRLLGPILAALARLPVTVIAATAGAPLGSEPPPNAFVADFLPGLDASRRADLVINNGGNLSTQQALAAGAPVLMVVSNLDQVVFAKAVRAAGAGEALREREVAPAPLRRLVWKLLHHRPYRDAARGLAATSARQDAGANFRAFVDDVLAGAAAGGAGAGA